MDYTSNLLGLQGILIDKFSENENSILIDISTSPKYPSCKYCRWDKTHILGYRYQFVKDIPIHSKPVMLRLRKRRYICPSCGKSFFESYDFLPRYYHLTNRLSASVLLEFKSSDSFKNIASKFSVSYNTVSRCLKLLPASHPNELPEVIGIDEFKGNASGEKYQCILTDVKNKTVFDILPNRNKSYLINYFRQFKNRDKVKYFVMDMTNNYKSIAWLFPNAEIVADRFHYVRQVYWALDTVRKEVQRNFPKYKRKYFNTAESYYSANMILYPKKTSKQ